MISVIMPVYNMGDKLKRGLESILNQTYCDIEVIIVDDGSQDNSYAICKEYEKTDSRVKLFHIQNQGSGKARNYGIERASGEYLYFMDADDEVDSKAFEILIKAIEKENVDLVVFGYYCINSRGNKIEKKQFKYRKETGEYVRQNYQDFVLMRCEYAIQGVPWNKLFRTAIVRENNIQYPDLRRQQDEIFIARYVACIRDICFIEDILYNYYINDLYAVWQKFPQNYMDISNSLLQYRLEIILNWNKENTEVKRWIYYSYMEGIIISLDIAFDPKLERSPKEIKNVIKTTLGKIKEIPYDSVTLELLSHKLVFFLIRHGCINMLYLIIKLKILIKKIIC